MHMATKKKGEKTFYIPLLLMLFKIYLAERIQKWKQVQSTEKQHTSAIFTYTHTHTLTPPVRTPLLYFFFFF